MLNVKCTKLHIKGLEFSLEPPQEISFGAKIPIKKGGGAKIWISNLINTPVFVRYHDVEQCGPALNSSVTIPSSSESKWTKKTCT